jgi:hypothetical protein
MTFGKVEIVEETIDALRHFDPEMDIRATLRDETFRIDSIEVGPRSDYDVTPIVKIVLREYQ